MDSVRNLLGQNLGDLRKARNHPSVALWMHSHNMSDLSEMGLYASPTLADGTNRPPSTASPPSNLIHPLDLPGDDGVPHTSGMAHTTPLVPILCRPLAVPTFHLPHGNCHVSQVTQAIA